MPDPILPRELKAEIVRFESKQRDFMATAAGKKTLRQIANFARTPLPGPDALRAAPKNFKDALATMGWINSLPSAVVELADLPLIDFDALPKRTRVQTLASSFAALDAGLRTLIAGAAGADKLAGLKVLQVAFGADKASAALRKPFSPDPKIPLPLLPGKIDIAKLVRDGTLRQALNTFVRCGVAARDHRDWAARIRLFGRVTALQPDRGCPGTTITVQFSGFGTTPLTVGAGSRFVIGLPRTGGRTLFVDIDQNALVFPGGNPRAWSDTGSLSIKLPDDISSGCVNFFVLPPVTQGGGCSQGSLIAAAGMIQSVFSAHGMGALGIQLAQNVSRDAIIADQPRFEDPAFRCAKDDPNWLNAGAPIIQMFRCLETGPVHPRSFVTLSWTVENADQVEIVAVAAVGSQSPHELPAIGGGLPASGTRQVAIPCSRRWTGRYVLRARNANGCTRRRPVEAGVILDSGFSHYRVGVARADITDARPGLAMAGFADEEQKTQATGTVLHPIFARAFVIESNSASPARRRVAIVVADIWTCTQAIKTAVVERLKEQPGPDGFRFGPNRYPADCILIAGTHTHAAPGGYSDYFLYNFSIGGFDAGVFNCVVNGIVAAIVRADAGAAPGRIFVNAGDLENCGKNRSMRAYRNNADVGGDDSLSVDKEMLLLKFERYRDNGGATTVPIGALNWYAIHPTNLGYLNTRISGDNKGWAESQFEAKLLADKQLAVVAAFGNACAGDISGNVGTGIPMGGPANTAALTGDIDRMKTFGQLQCDRALELFDAAVEEVTGPIEFRYAHVDMSNVPIAANPGARTWPAAIGVSFGAGSSEDSQPAVYIEGHKLVAKIAEGISTAEFTEGAIVFWVIGGPALVGVLGGVLGSLALGPLGWKAALATVVAVRGLIEVMPVTAASSYMFSLIGKLAFAGKVTDPQPGPGGTWTWLAPDILFPPADYVAGHGMKPIMFPVGLWKLRFTPSDTSQPVVDHDCPLVPHVLPMQVMQIGQVMVVGVPAEMTATGGRRLKAGIRAILGRPDAKIAISNYSNAYSGYVTTPEEYDVQEYEGASTLYGPHTLAAYEQEIGKLAQAIVSGSQVAIATPLVPGPFSVPAKYHKP